MSQLYLTSAAGQSEYRLLGFQRVVLRAGERRGVEIEVDPRLLAHFDVATNRWRLQAGVYGLSLARSAEEAVASARVALAFAEFP